MLRPQPDYRQRRDGARDDQQVGKLMPASRALRFAGGAASARGRGCGVACGTAALARAR